MFRLTNWLFAVVLALTLASCSGPAQLRRQLARQWEQPGQFGNGFSGFILLDPVSGEVLFQRQADRYFTPASNAKLLTFFTALRVLPDSLPLLACAVAGDQLYCRGTGHPGFLHPDWPLDSAAIRLLQGWPGPVFLYDDHFLEKRYGPGWAWDDYVYAYQAERSPLPLYGNLARFRKDSLTQTIVVEPAYFTERTSLTSGLLPWREEAANSFHLPESVNELPYFDRKVPFSTSGPVVAALLTDTLGRQVTYAPGPCPAADSTFILFSDLPADSLYCRLLQNSDNFIAEQLLLLCSYQLAGRLQSRIALQYALDSLLYDLADPPLWFDGSGLSRYNQLTPRSLAQLLTLLYRQWPPDRILRLFPAGGQSGTLREWYAADPPFVFAKTGTLRGVHCLSGYLQTHSGRWLVFSFMHNNFPEGSAQVKADMDRFLRAIKARY